MPTKLRRCSLPAASIALALIALTGCTDTKPASPPKPTVEPVFASEEEALAAVTETYEEFLRVSNQILQDGGANPERIDAITSAEQAEVEHEAYGRMREAGFRTVGDIRLSEPRLRQVFDHPDSIGVVAKMFACEIISGVDIVDSTGDSQVPPGRPEAIGFDVSVGLTEGDNSELIILAKDAEEGASTC